MKISYYLIVVILVLTLTSCSFMNRPPEVKLISPEDGETGMPISGIVLRWNASDPENDPITYTVYIGKSADSMSKILVKIPKYEITDILDYNEEYCWKVVAVDSFGNESKSPDRCFKTFGVQKREASDPDISTVEDVWYNGEKLYVVGEKTNGKGYIRVLENLDSDSFKDIGVSIPDGKLTSIFDTYVGGFNGDTGFVWNIANGSLYTFPGVEIYDIEKWDEKLVIGGSKNGRAFLRVGDVEYDLSASAAEAEVKIYDSGKVNFTNSGIAGGYVQSAEGKDAFFVDIEKNLVFVFDDGGDEEFFDVIEVDDGYIAVGRKGENQSVVVKYDKYGNLLWKQFQSGVIYGAIDWKGVLIGTGEKDRKAWMTGIDENTGDILWSETLSETLGSSIEKSIPTAEGIVTVGIKNKKLFLVTFK